MEWSKEKVEEILSQSDEQLKTKLARVFEVLGVPAHVKRQVLSDLSLLRLRAEEVTEADVQRAKQLVGEDVLGDLVKILEKNDG